MTEINKQLTEFVIRFLEDTKISGERESKSVTTNTSKTLRKTVQLYSFSSQLSKSSSQLKKTHLVSLLNPNIVGRTTDIIITYRLKKSHILQHGIKSSKIKASIWVRRTVINIRRSNQCNLKMSRQAWIHCWVNKCRKRTDKNN